MAEILEGGGSQYSEDWGKRITGFRPSVGYTARPCPKKPTANNIGRCVSYLPHHCDETLDQSNLRKEGFILAPSQRAQSMEEGREGVVARPWGSWPHCTHSWEEERGGCWHSACRLLFMRSFPPQLTYSRKFLTHMPRDLPPRWF